MEVVLDCSPLALGFCLAKRRLYVLTNLAGNRAGDDPPQKKRYRIQDDSGLGDVCRNIGSWGPPTQIHGGGPVGGAGDSSAENPDPGNQPERRQYNSLTMQFSRSERGRLNLFFAHMKSPNVL